MGDISQFLPDQKKLLDFVAEREPWCHYRLENGVIIRLKVVLTKVHDNGRHAGGMPDYGLSWQQVVDVTWTPEIEAEIARCSGEQT
jgi:hypothetical protein